MVETVGSNTSHAGGQMDQQSEPFKITVFVRESEFTVFCGAGTQKIRWLSDVALHRYQHFTN